MEVIRTFKSRRNRVSLLKSEGGLLVEKVCSDRSGAEAEAAVYALLRGSALKAPRLIEADHDRLLLSFLPGMNYVRVLEAQEQTGPEDLPWDKLLDWLMDFRTLTGKNMADVNLRNFLYDPECGEAAGLDFEDCRPGTPEEMIAGLCAYVLLYDPPRTEVKQRIVQHILDRCREKKLCDLHLLRSQIGKEITVIQNRRLERETQGKQADPQS